jgi:hypothetical protein
MNPDHTTLTHLLDDVRLHRLDDRALYKAIYQFGRQGFVQARPTVETFLTHENPDLRYIALEVLTRHWHLEQHWETARRFLEQDDDTQCRMMGASALAVLRRNSQDTRTLQVLARVVRDNSEKVGVREATYAAMREIIQYDPREQLRLSGRDLDLERDIDWNMVDSYLP